MSISRRLSLGFFANQRDKRSKKTIEIGIINEALKFC